MVQTLLCTAALAVVFTMQYVKPQKYREIGELYAKATGTEPSDTGAAGTGAGPPHGPGRGDPGTGRGRDGSVIAGLSGGRGRRERAPAGPRGPAVRARPGAVPPAREGTGRG